VAELILEVCPPLCDPLKRSRVPLAQAEGMSAIRFSARQRSFCVRFWHVREQKRL
jgi:hypothetical protein